MLCFLPLTNNSLVILSKVASIALSLAYSIPIQKRNDPYVQLAEDAMQTVTYAAVPGTFLVDMLPVLKYVPEWVPGAGFQKVARQWNALQRRFRKLPFDETVRSMVNLNPKPDDSNID